MPAPCSVCGETTEWCCSDCAIDGLGRVYVCAKSSCRDTHDQRDIDRGCKAIKHGGASVRNLNQPGD